MSSKILFSIEHAIEVYKNLNDNEDRLREYCISKFFYVDPIQTLKIYNDEYIFPSHYNVINHMKLVKDYPLRVQVVTVLNILTHCSPLHLLISRQDIPLEYNILIYMSRSGHIELYNKYVSRIGDTIEKHVDLDLNKWIIPPEIIKLDSIPTLCYKLLQYY